MTKTSDAATTPIDLAKRMWTNGVKFMKEPITWWMYDGNEVRQLDDFLAANNLTRADIGVTDEEVNRILVRRHMLAAEVAWRLCFKNESSWSVSARIAQMEINLKAAGKTRLDLGLLQNDSDWLTQHPDLEIAMMNAGRLKWVPRRWDPQLQKYVIYEFAGDGTLVPSN